MEAWSWPLKFSIPVGDLNPCVEEFLAPPLRQKSSKTIHCNLYHKLAFEIFPKSESSAGFPGYSPQVKLTGRLLCRLWGVAPLSPRFRYTTDPALNITLAGFLPVH